MGSGGRAVERRTVNRRDGGSIPPTAILKLRQFRSPHICLCLLEETLNIWWSLLSGVYARGSKRSHTGGKCVTCRGLTNSHWTLNALLWAPSSIWEKERKRETNSKLQTLLQIYTILNRCTVDKGKGLGGCQLLLNMQTVGQYTFNIIHSIVLAT